MDLGVTRMSSKGQIVIPSDLRGGFNEGEKFVIIRENDTLIMRKADNLDKNFQEDLEFAKRTEKAMNEIEKGNYTEMEFDDFLNESKKW
jgi:AbrB family looped-hinge helix DNA binding protein